MDKLQSLRPSNLLGDENTPIVLDILVVLVLLLVLLVVFGFVSYTVVKSEEVDETDLVDDSVAST